MGEQPSAIPAGQSKNRQISLPVTHEGLTESARGFAARALTAYTGGDTAVILTYAGIALEHLSKAVLCNRDPAYLAELRNDDFNSLLRLTGRSLSASPKPLKTIGAGEALKRVERFVKLTRLEELRSVVDARNGVLHVGTTDAVEHKPLLTAVLSAVIVLVEDLGINPGEFFDAQWSLAEGLLNNRKSDVDHEVQRLMAAATKRYEQMLEGLSDQLRAEMITLRLRIPDPPPLQEANYRGQQTCPACANEAGLFGSVELREEVDWDVEGSSGPAYPAGVYLIARFSPDHFLCTVCGLELDGVEQLRVSALAEPYDLDDSDYDTDAAHLAYYGDDSYGP